MNDYTPYLLAAQAALKRASELASLRQYSEAAAHVAIARMHCGRLQTALQGAFQQDRDEEPNEEGIGNAIGN